MTTHLALHIDDDALELHALGRDPRTWDPAAIEEHVQWCQRCLKRLAAEREYVHVVRAALRTVPMEPAGHDGSRPGDANATSSLSTKVPLTYCT
jgi:hypothetical protein